MQKIASTTSASMTYLQALEYLEPYYNALTMEQKKRCFLVVGDNVVYSIERIQNGSFTSIVNGQSASSPIVLISLVITQHKAYDYRNNTQTDTTSQPTNGILELWA